MFPDADAVVSNTQRWLQNVALDLEAGRISVDQARVIARRNGLRIVKAIYGPYSAWKDRPGLTLLETIDPVVAWRSLSIEARDAIGAAAIAATVGVLGADIAMERADIFAYRPRRSASEEAQSLLRALVNINVLEGDDTDLPPRPDLRPLGIRQCRTCGCTDDFACDGGCSWVETDLCSACVPKTRDG